MREIISGVYTWSWLSPKHGYGFNGFAFESDGGLIVIDPAIMGEDDFDELLKLGNPETVILTNKDHERVAYDLRDKFGSKIYIDEKDATFLKASPDRTFRDREIIPGNLRAINVPNNKSPGETALLLSRDKGILFIGDAIIGWPKGEFSLLPFGKYENPQMAKESVKVLLEYDFDTVLVGDGESILRGGKEAVRRFLDREENLHLTLPVQ
ncbi:hypothetical protein MYX76_06710 [Desulfobacterota bacterium AH_259_B03_O07]|nr:hypothetical protein [Desulfobacterota bacterium AH_259_B03_O07]